MTVTIEKNLDTLILAKGSHGSRHEAVCLMEAVAYFNNEPWSDHPACACPVLTAFGIGLNDAWGDEDRQRLKPFIPKLIGTRSTPAVEHKRSVMALDWLVQRMIDVKPEASS